MKLSAAQIRLSAVIAILSIASGLIYFSNYQHFEVSAYQAAVAHAMSHSFTDWLFGAVDPAGTVSLDKIPGSYWITAIFVRLFGFHDVTVIAPNGLATIGAIIAIALAGRRIAKFNTASDVLADAVALATGLIIIATPIISAVARSNEPESFFFLYMALAFHRSVVALQTGKRSQLIFAGLWIGFAFQTYMIEAWVFWPALIIAWFTLADKSRLTKLVDLLIAGASSLALSLLWIFIVTLTPASARPFVGGTLKNSAWEMVFGYNALGRLSANSDTKLYRSFTPKFAGEAGILRLFNIQDAGQIAWLIVAAAVALVVLFLVQEFDSTLVLAGVSFVLFYLEYSFVAGMHQYYTAIIALPIALIVAYLITHGKTWMFILVGLVAAITAFLINHAYPGYFPVMSYLPFVALVALVVLAGLMPERRGVLGLVLALTLVVTPVAWSIDTINRSTPTNPVAGPELPKWARVTTHVKNEGAAGAPVVHRTLKQDVAATKELKAYLEKNIVGHPKYPLATFGAQVASPIMNLSGLEVLPIGGFSGFDAVPTFDKFKQLIADKQLQYVIYDSGWDKRGATGNTALIAAHVLNDCKHVSSNIFGELYHCTY